MCYTFEQTYRHWVADQAQTILTLCELARAWCHQTAIHAGGDHAKWRVVVDDFG